MFINIITPCSRPQNLHTIAKSINIPRENYRWIVVFDSEELPSEELIPEECEAYAYKNVESISGNGQRNYAIDKVERGYLYFNDDDTIMHKDLWESIREINADFVTFSQEWPDGTIRLEGKNIGVNFTDSHNFIVNHNIVGEVRFRLGVYAADGFFAFDTASKTKNIAYIPKVLSTYNLLR
jgi:hypothetical protein